MDKQKERYTAAKQEHVFKYLDKLTEEEKKTLLADLESIDPNGVNQLYSDLIVNKKKDQEIKDAKIERIESELVCPSDTVGAEQKQLGHDIIRTGKVAVVVLAGGQGSRLGFEHPKGMYDIGLKSGKSIF